MDGDAHDLEFLVASTVYEIQSLKDDPRLGPVMGTRGEALRDHILDLVGAAQHRLAQQPDPSASPNVRQAYARNLRQLLGMLRLAQKCLPWLAATRSPTVNLGSLYLTEEFARHIVGTNVDLVVVTSPEYMYSEESWLFREVIAQTTGYVPHMTTRRPMAMFYPLTDADRVLMHTVMAHELGHASAEEYDLVASAEQMLDNDPTFVASLDSTVNAISSPGHFSTSLVASALRQVLRSWLLEILCDHLAIAVAGPAFLWSFAGFALPYTYASPGDEHPPNSLRIRLALDYLVSGGWQPFMEDVAPGVTAWLRGVAADATVPLAPAYAFMRDELLRRQVELQQIAIARVGIGVLEPSGAGARAHEAAALLRRLILPIGLEEPLELRAILLGGWIEAFIRHGDGPAGVIGALGDLSLQELIGKAMELSVVATEWSSHR